MCTVDASTPDTIVHNTPLQASILTTIGIKTMTTTYTIVHLQIDILRQYPTHYDTLYHQHSAYTTAADAISYPPKYEPHTVLPKHNTTFQLIHAYNSQD